MARSSTTFAPGHKAKGGRPPAGQSLTETLRLFLSRPSPYDINNRTYRECMIDKLVSKAIGGDLTAINSIFDRTEGKAPQALTLQGDKDKPLEVIIKVLGV